MSGEAPSAAAGGDAAWLALPRRMLANLARWFGGLLPVSKAALTCSIGRTEFRAAIVVSVAIVAVIMVYVDAAVAAWASRLPEWFIDPVNWFTDFGKSGWFLVPTGLVVLAIAALDRPQLPARTRRALDSLALRFGFLFAAVGVPSLFTTIVKRLIGRARPLIEGNDPFLYHPFAWRSEYASLPSGHATTGFAIAFAVGLLWPRARALVWAYALAIAFSRVALTAHHLSDVVAAAVVAFVGVVLVRDIFAAQEAVFAFRPDGVWPLPGPSWGRIKAVARTLAAS